MTLRRCATTPMGMAGTSAFAYASCIKPWAVPFGGATLAQSHDTANRVTEWSMGPMEGSTG